MIEKNPGSVSIQGKPPLIGEITPPGDKSISHRGLLLGGVADGRTVLQSLAPGEDVESTINCLIQLGVPVLREENRTVVEGQGLGGFNRPDRALDAGNSGTLARLISGILAAHPFLTEIDGDESLRTRPMERIIDPLEKMGAEISSREGKLPLAIRGGELRGIEHSPRVASAQVKSSVLLAGLGASGETVVVEPGPSRDHTERLLSAMGCPVRVSGDRVTVKEISHLDPLELKVPGDFSSASYFIAAALLVEGSELTVRDVGLNETRTGFLDLLTRMGASIEVRNSRVESGEPRGDLLVTPSRLNGVSLAEEEVVKTIDELPLLAVVATQAEGVTEVRGAEELRVKETDRIRATVDNLENLGAKIEELPDGFVVEGRTGLQDGELNSFGDHRIAMSNAVAGLVAEGKTYLKDPGWVEVSFPNFFRTLEGLTDG